LLRGEVAERERSRSRSANRTHSKAHSWDSSCPSAKIDLTDEISHLLEGELERGDGYVALPSAVTAARTKGGENEGAWDAMRRRRSAGDLVLPASDGRNRRSVADLPDVHVSHNSKEREPAKKGGSNNVSDRSGDGNHRGSVRKESYVNNGGVNSKKRASDLSDRSGDINHRGSVRKTNDAPYDDEDRKAVDVETLNESGRSSPERRRGNAKAKRRGSNSQSATITELLTEIDEISAGDSKRTNGGLQSSGSSKHPFSKLSPCALLLIGGCCCFCILIIGAGLGFCVHFVLELYDEDDEVVAAVSGSEGGFDGSDDGGGSSKVGPSTDVAASIHGPSIGPSLSVGPSSSPSAYFEDWPSSPPSVSSSGAPAATPSASPSAFPTISSGPNASPSSMPTNAPTSSPSASVPPTTSPSYSTRPECPERLLKTATLGDDETIITLNYEVVPYEGDDLLERGGLLCASLEYEGLAGWIGLAFSGASRDPERARREAVIGIVQAYPASRRPRPWRPTAPRDWDSSGALWSEGRGLRIPESTRSRPAASTGTSARASACSWTPISRR